MVCPSVGSIARHAKAKTVGNLGVGGASAVAWFRNRANGGARKEARTEEVLKEEEKEVEREEEGGDIRIAARRWGPRHRMVAKRTRVGGG